MAIRHGSVAALGAFALALLVMCSSTQAEDGESCGVNADCSSRTCVEGVCAGSDCKCEGASCRGRSSCREGWLCTRSNAGALDPLPVCRQECAGGAGSCRAGSHCENGVCFKGADAFTLAWANIPRTRPCASMVPCDYRLKPPDVVVTKYTWFFDGSKVETTEPSASFTYPRDGTYGVTVKADGPNGATAMLQYSEVLCSGVLGSPCSTTGAPCCAGTCDVTGLCK